MALEPEVRSAKLDLTPPPDYALPNPLLSETGQVIGSAEQWRNQRRPELLEHFSRDVYGRTPTGQPAAFRAEVTSTEHQALGGLATRKEVTLWLDSQPTSPAVHCLLYIPNANVSSAKHPAFLGLNFYGNHSVHRDPGITRSEAWIMKEAPGVVDHHATETSRGTDADKWPIEAIVGRGYAVVTAYCGDLCPDRADGLGESVNHWLTQTTTESRAPEAWGAIGVWAWGLSRILDYLESDPDIDASRVVVTGHSRLGKAALWAGAQDERFAAVISNESGCGGAALSKRIHGETVARINQTFPHWFARNFRKFDNHESELPVDQHELLALIAPRPLYVASAEGDDWADPEGEFLSVKGAQPVYQLFGITGPLSSGVPPVHSPSGDALRYHIRSGPHDMTAYDWSRYLDFADQCLPKLSATR
ncbi:MAG: acetylxylan esterase [Opitutus sp.]